MTMDIDVRRAQWSDREQIFSFYKKAYSDWEQRIPERWDWQITHNPFRPEGPPPVWLALDKAGNVIGQTMAMFEPMLLAGKEILNAWSVDSYVLEEYRSKGVGRRLRELMNAELSQIMSIMMSPATRHIYQTQGFLALPPLEEYLLAADPQNITESLAQQHQGKLGQMVRILRLGYPIAWYLNRQNHRRRRRLLVKDPDLRFVSVQSFPADIDVLWQHLHGLFGGAVLRSAAYLNWKYPGQPHVNYQIFLIYQKDILAGYLVLRLGQSRGFIVDMLLDPEPQERMVRVLDFAVTYFSQHGVKEVRIASSYPPYLECLRKIAWAKPVRIRVPMVKSQYLAEQDRQTEARWLFALGDHDMQQ